MSLKALSWAWDQKITSTQKIALLALADCHNGATGQCNPHISYIIEKTCLHRNTVIKVLREMESMGLLSRSREYSKGYWYTLNLSLIFHEKPSKVLNPVPNFQVLKPVPTKVLSVVPTKVLKPVLNHYIEPEVEPEREGRQAATRSNPVIKSPPSKEQVSAHMASKGHSITDCNEWADRFINFYDSKGWLVGKTPMVRWKSSATNWANDNAKKHPPAPAASHYI